MLKLLSFNWDYFNLILISQIKRYHTTQKFYWIKRLARNKSLSWLVLMKSFASWSHFPFVRTKVFDLDAFIDILAHFNPPVVLSKAFTSEFLKYSKILASDKMNVVATFIADKCNLIEIVQAVKIPFKCWCQLDGQLVEKNLLQRPL